MKLCESTYKQGQSIIEVSMAIALTIVVVMATVRLWQWATASMNVRYIQYRATRPSAVRSIDDGSFGQWFDPGNQPLTLLPR